MVSTNMQRNNAPEIIVIPGCDAMMWWPKLKPFYEMGIKRGEGEVVTLAETKQGLQEGWAYALALFLNGEMVGAASLNNGVSDDGKKVLLFAILGMTKGTFVLFADQLKKCTMLIAGWCGAERLEMQGRKGWYRILKRYGAFEENGKMRMTLWDQANQAPQPHKQ